MSKNKSKFVSLFESFDAELDKQDAQLDAGHSLSTETPEDLAELGIDTNTSDEGAVTAPEAEAEPSGKVVLELDDAQVKLLIAVLAKLKGNSTPETSTTPPEEPALGGGPSLDDLSLGGQEPPIGEDEEDILGVDSSEGVNAEALTPEEATFLEELHAALVGAKEETVEEVPGEGEDTEENVTPEDTLDSAPPVGEDEEVQTLDKTIPPMA